MEKLLTSFGAQYGVKFLGKKKVDLAKRTVAFFFEESASQTRALSPVSTV